MICMYVMFILGTRDLTGFLSSNHLSSNEEEEGSARDSSEVREVSGNQDQARSIKISVTLPTLDNLVNKNKGDYSDRLVRLKLIKNKLNFL